MEVQNSAKESEERKRGINNNLGKKKL
jgi:hypothetical protein